MEDLKNELIKITGVELVEKGNDDKKWKEYDVKVKDYVKGTHYAIPLKKVDGKETNAYAFFKAHRNAWEELFIDGKAVEIEIAYSAKTVNWDRDGKQGTSIYKTIRMFNEMPKKTTKTKTVVKEVNEIEYPEDETEDIPF